MWFLLSILWLIIQLPYRVQLAIGRQLGKLAYHVAKREKKIARINIALCFPEWSKEKQEDLLRKSFISMGMGTIETAFGWLGSKKRLQGLARIHHEHYLHQGLAKGNGALIFTAHFSPIHIGGRLMTFTHPYGAMFFPQKNPVLQWVSWRAMKKHYQAAIARDDARGFIRALKKNLPICYTSDVDGGKKNSIFAPFFGISAATVSATSRFAQLTGAAVIPCFYYRRADYSGYEITYHPPLENFPSDDLYADTLRINQIIEAVVREHPEQYLWQYKRFKTRPSGEQKIY